MNRKIVMHAINNGDRRSVIDVLNDNWINDISGGGAKTNSIIRFISPNGDRQLIHYAKSGICEISPIPQKMKIKKKRSFKNYSCPPLRKSLY